MNFPLDVLSLDAAMFVYNSDAEDSQNEDEFSDSSATFPLRKREMGRRIYKKVVTMNPVRLNILFTAVQTME